ncbi:hypothetical protein FQN53_000974, partial [Emmonsiellopsis sp. PD_33]
MNLLQSTNGGISTKTSFLAILLSLFAILTLSVALPIEKQPNHPATNQIANIIHEIRSLPGSLATAPEGAVGEPPHPASGDPPAPEPTATPVYFALLAIVALLGVILKG